VHAMFSDAIEIMVRGESISATMFASVRACAK
jgi:hypothetical protein